VGDGPTSVPHAGASAAPTLRLRGVGRRFGGLLAVDGVDLDVAQGERRAVLGPNGAGKTTLFNLICGDIPPSSGTIELYGEDVTRRPARARAGLGLARTYQQSRHLLGLTVEDSIYLSILGVEGGRLRPVLLRRDAEIRERARMMASVDEGVGLLLEALEHVRTGAVTHAARDDAEGRFRRGDAVGFVDEQLVAWGEPGETLEEAVRREVLEESGVALDSVAYLSSQPWPFPSSLMLGFSAVAARGDPAPGDDELAEVRWFDREEVARAARGDGPLMLAPPYSIARRLIDAWLAER